VCGENDCYGHTNANFSDSGQKSQQGENVCSIAKREMGQPLIQIPREREIRGGGPCSLPARGGGGLRNAVIEEMEGVLSQEGNDGGIFGQEKRSFLLVENWQIAVRKNCL